jgi:hypothetical protein
MPETETPEILGFSSDEGEKADEEAWRDFAWQHTVL